MTKLTKSLGTASPGAIWSQVELSVGIISACLPVYRPLFTPRSRGSTKGSAPDHRQAHTSRNTPLNTRNSILGNWSNNVTSVTGPEDTAHDRPFVILKDPDFIHQEASFTVAREA